jgi:hypothetical protein
MPGQAFFSFWRSIRKAVSLGNSPESTPPFAWPGHGLGQQDFPAELHGLIEAALAVRERILANRFLRGWVRWWTWILVGLLAAAALSPRLAIPLISAAVVLALGGVAVGLRTWRTRPSPYEAACKLDSAAGLHDRFSTAIYFGAARSPDEMILCQRQDALKHLGRVNPRALFAVRLPATARRSVLLAMAVVGLLVYRVYYQPPVVTLLRAVARSQTAQAILNPLKQAVQQDIERMLALASQTADAMNEQKEVDANDSHDDLWKANEKDASDQDAGAKQMQEGDSGDAQQGQSGEQNGPQTESQTGMNSQDAQQQGASSQSSKSSGASAKANSQQQNAGNSQNSHESLTQSLVQALKNLLSSSQSQQKSDERNAKNHENSPQGPPQSANSQQTGSGESRDKQQQSGGISDAQQKQMTKENGAGAGSQPGYKQMKKNEDQQVAKTLADRVVLQNNGSNENVRIRIPTETGKAKIALGDASPSGLAEVKGAEQENVPARYRSYVQHYFEHSNSESR